MGRSIKIVLLVCLALPLCLMRSSCLAGQNHSRPPKSVDAVALAERFIKTNGYTAAAPTNPGWLALEPIEFGTISDIIAMRHDTLRPVAYGVIRGRRGKGKAGWTIVFQYVKPDNPGDGRAVTMDRDGTPVRVEHEDFYLRAVRTFGQQLP